MNNWQSSLRELLTRIGELLLFSMRRFIMCKGYFLSQNPSQPYKIHSHRDAAIRYDTHIGGIWNDYRSLKDWSQKARYEGEKPGDNDFKNDILKSLQAIKKTINQYITIP